MHWLREGVCVHFRPLETLGGEWKKRESRNDRWKDDGARGQVIEIVCGLTTGIVGRIEGQREIGWGVCEVCGRGGLDEVIEMKMVGSG